MFQTKTVIVVGAGASCELGFPSGEMLLKQIANALDIRLSSGSNMDHGDSRVYEAYRRLATGSDGRMGSVNIYQHAGWRVRDAAHLGLSIDNVINQFDDDPLVAQIGKLAIAQQILRAEQNSILKLPRNSVESLSILVDARSTWLGGFAQLLVQDKTRRTLDDLFDNVSIISFNYDRSIRRFLPLALMSQFGMAEAEANDLAKNLPIFHPYGSLGPLPWEKPRGGVQFGDADHAPLIKVAERLRTFTEQVGDGEDLIAMRQAIAEASQIVFLGFGYHRQNMALLAQGVIGSASRVYGTAMGLSEEDGKVVIDQLKYFIPRDDRMFIKPKLSSL